VKILDNKHPICVAEKILARYGKNIIFELSNYINLRQSIEDIRYSFTLSGNQMNRMFVEDIIGSLPKGKELALHSKIIDVNGNTVHIPMIDFAGKLNKNSIKLVSDMLPSQIVDNMFFFKSGSSYHAYSTALITQDEWVKFMGRILLLNLPQKDPIIDSRWVGHRLLAGYSSLRWSCNTNDYKTIPSLIDLKTIN
jgi:hypothetical protein